MKMNWEKRINRAERRGEFTKTDVKDATGWTHCQVGEHLDIPKNDAMNLLLRFPSRFMDYFKHTNLVRMRVLGRQFSGAIRLNDFDVARSIREKIINIKPYEVI